MSYILTLEGVKKCEERIEKLFSGQSKTFQAEAINLSRDTIRNIETRKKGVQKKSLERYCDGLGWDREIDLIEGIHYEEYVNTALDSLGEILILGGYKITELLNSTGNYDTYLGIAQSLPSQKKCIIKRLKNERGEIGKELFEREAKVLERLGEHNQIPRLLGRSDQPDENQYFYLVHDFIEGTTLNQEILEKKPWFEEKVITLLQEILELLTYVHSEGVIHRDTNPQNLIRRSSDGRIVLTNFGSVKQISTEIQTMSIAGTPGYMASEQEFGTPRLASDIYAVGIIGIQALTGTIPKTRNYETKEIIWRDKAKVSPEFGNILDKMVKFDCENRYQSAAEALQAFSAIQ